MNIIQSVITSFDRFQRRHHALGFPLAVVKKFGDDEAGHQAALLAYYGFLAIFPLLLVLTTVLKLVIRHNDALRTRIIGDATAYFPIVGSELQKSVHGLSGTGVILAIGLVLTFFGARGVADALRGGINHIWQIPYVRRSGFPKSILQSLGSMLVGGLGLLLAPLLSGYAVSLGGHSWLVRGAALLLTLVILFGVFLLLVRIALPTHVPQRDLWPAAAISAIGLTALQLAGTYILTRQTAHLQNLYGTFYIVLGLLYWLYLQAQLFFYAVEVASVRALKLWPRAIDQKYLTSQDQEAFRLYAGRNRYYADEEIRVINHKK